MKTQRQKIIFVTGAANGIGEVITLYLANKGEYVIATDFDEKALEKYNDNENIFPIFLDVTNQPSIDNAFEQIKKKNWLIDCLINNAGIFVGGSIIDVEMKDFEKILNINVLGYVRVTKAFFPLLNKEQGKIINISSEVGRISFPFNAPYSMSKYAIEAFSDALRRELRFIGPKVITIQPGAIKTHLSISTEESYEHYLKGSIFSDQIQRLWKVLEEEKYGKPIDIAKLIYKILYKKSPKIRYRIHNNRQRRILEFLPAKYIDFLIEKFI
ncbi:MAG: SDR family oxidoreductase [Candidatus Heimdallarchaeaceae archaeon]